MKYQFLGQFIQATAESAEDNVALIGTSTLTKSVGSKPKKVHVSAFKGVPKSVATQELRDMLQAIPLHSKRFVGTEEANKSKDFPSFAYQYLKNTLGRKVSVTKVTGGYEVEVL